MELAPNTLISRVDKLGSRVDEEMVFFDQDAGKYYATGAVGADIWDYLEAPRSLAAICDHLASIYEIERAACETEVRAFLKQMLQAQMIEAKTP